MTRPERVLRLLSRGNVDLRSDDPFVDPAPLYAVDDEAELLLDALQEVSPFRKRSSMCAEPVEIHSSARSVQVEAELDQMVEAGYLPLGVLRSWLRSLDAVRHELDIFSEPELPTFRTDDHAPEALSRFLATCDAEIIPSLGDYFDAVLLFCGGRYRGVFARDAFTLSNGDLDAAALSLVAQQMYLESAEYALRVGSGWWLHRSHRPSAARFPEGGIGPPGLFDLDTIADEVTGYADHRYPAEVELPSVRRQKAARRLAAMCDALGPLRCLMAYDASRCAIEIPRDSSICRFAFRRLPLLFTDDCVPVRVRQNGNAYLLWRHPTLGHCRWWIPSRRVIWNLGIAEADLFEISEPIPSDYANVGTLLAWEDVCAARAALESQCDVPAFWRSLLSPSKLQKVRPASDGSFMVAHLASDSGQVAGSPM